VAANFSAAPVPEGEETFYKIATRWKLSDCETVLR
jgi:hypothetical protein